MCECEYLRKSMKRCSRCHIEKEESEFKLSRKSNGKCYLGWCKDCSREAVRICNKKRTIRGRTIRNQPLPENKICAHCKKEKPAKDYRVRYDKRSEPIIQYLNNTCRECDAEISRINQQKVRSTPEGRRRHCDWARTSYKRRRDKVIVQMKERRQTPEYKEMMRQYRQRNKTKIYDQEVVTKKRYHIKHRDGLTDGYIRRLFIGNGLGEPTPELIQAKRIQLLIQRKTKNYAHSD